MIWMSCRCGWLLEIKCITVASGDADEVDASTDGYTYTFPAGSDMFPAGTTFYLIAEDCETPDPPAGTITQLTATPAMGGDIVIAYNYDCFAKF